MVDAFAKGSMLQIILISLLLGVALVQLGERSRALHAGELTVAFAAVRLGLRLGVGFGLGISRRVVAGVRGRFVIVAAGGSDEREGEEQRRQQAELAWLAHVMGFLCVHQQGGREYRSGPVRVST